jgi:outer membrane protein OmpA-like peptidoglycan-associated protein
MHRGRTLCLAAFTCLIGLSAPQASRAEIGGFHVNITPFGGYRDWAKEANLDSGGLFGGKLGVMFGRYVGIEAYYSWMSSGTEYGSGDSLFFPVGLPPQTPNNALDVQGYGLDVTLNLPLGSRISPYVFGGWHEEKVTSDGPGVKTFLNGPEFGGGVKIAVGSRTSLVGELRDQLWGFDSPPAPDPPGNDNLHNLSYSGGLQVSLGGEAGKDADNDDVADSKDDCPNTPAGALVDVRGCPLDADRDNVPDGIDQCPNTPQGATVDARGCPSDADNDGVPDGIDQCPATPGGTQIDARGCPADQDSDGVPDGVDQCANTPAGSTVDARGCPSDADMDGVPDGLDQCPNTPAGAKVDARGCSADSDNDGVNDDKDICPNTQANVKVDAEGCPLELTEREVELLDKGVITARDIHFETAKWDILPESRPILDEIGKILIQWPQLRIEIGGHADARGSDAYNLDLTQKRSRAVLEYLVANFPQIKGDQYTARGYGERVPVASNKTVEGMARNRRVEFKVLNTEELKKERERRSQLKRGE